MFVLTKIAKKTSLPRKQKISAVLAAVQYGAKHRKKKNVEREHGRKKNTVEKRKTQKNKY